MVTRTITLPTPDLFDFDQCLFFLDRGYDECLYQLSDRLVLRAIEFEGTLIPFSITEKEGKLLIEIESSVTVEAQKQVLAYVNEWFDIDRDLSPFYELLSVTKSLKPLLEKYKGLRLIGIPSLFEALCWSVIGQQINLTFAFKLKRRLVETYGKSIKFKGHTLYHFPSPESLAALDEDYLRTQQYSRGKIKYIKNVAEAFLNHGLSKKALAQIPDFESRQQTLTAIKGIGVWSANYALMKTLHQPEAIPFGDTGLTQSLYNLKIIADRKDEPAIVAFFEEMKGWEAYTVFYLWRSLAG
ncbi:DNA-3-methyladenine glycosylase family protein [Roseivirga sp.]|uniref:DNA-3-methyladenine glycosylase family protein n=1 Tax=Roseivirga sp. TaxID=1964215 RepID=UPI003B8DDB82